MFEETVSAIIQIETLWKQRSLDYSLLYDWPHECFPDHEHQ